MIDQPSETPSQRLGDPSPTPGIYYQSETPTHPHSLADPSPHPLGGDDPT